MMGITKREYFHIFRHFCKFLPLGWHFITFVRVYNSLYSYTEEKKTICIMNENYGLRTIFFSFLHTYPSKIKQYWYQHKLNIWIIDLLRNLLQKYSNRTSEIETETTAYCFIIYCVLFSASSCGVCFTEYHCPTSISLLSCLY